MFTENYQEPQLLEVLPMVLLVHGTGFRAHMWHMCHMLNVSPYSDLYRPMAWFPGAYDLNERPVSRSAEQDGAVRLQSAVKLRWWYL